MSEIRKEFQGAGLTNRDIIAMTGQSNAPEPLLNSDNATSKEIDEYLNNPCVIHEVTAKRLLESARDSIRRLVSLRRSQREVIVSGHKLIEDLSKRSMGIDEIAEWVLDAQQTVEIGVCNLKPLTFYVDFRTHDNATSDRCVTGETLTQALVYVSESNA